MSSDLPEPTGNPSGDPFSDIPLFREIQRVLMSSSGPVNWELARQVGMAVAASSGGDPAPGADELRGGEETVGAAQLHVARLTGLKQPADVVKVETLRRSQWVEA